MHLIHIHKDHPISKTLSLRQHQSVLVDSFGPSSSRYEQPRMRLKFGQRCVACVSYVAPLCISHLYRHLCNNSLTLTHLNDS